MGGRSLLPKLQFLHVGSDQRYFERWLVVGGKSIQAGTLAGGLFAFVSTMRSL